MDELEVIQTQQAVTDGGTNMLETAPTLINTITGANWTLTSFLILCLVVMSAYMRKFLPDMQTMDKKLDAFTTKLDLIKEIMEQRMAAEKEMNNLVLEHYKTSKSEDNFRIQSILEKLNNIQTYLDKASR